MAEAELRREEAELEHDWGELCKDAPRSDQVSARLAVCNVDWDRLKAKDLLVLLNSFVPKGGAVLSVKIYPSEFGKERLKLEETQAPPELKASLPEDDTAEDRVHRERRRDYQFKRLRYFYGVAECDSAHTAAHVYEQCDGYEYESSCSVLDLRFIPDHVTFQDEPRDSASDLNQNYTPKLFTSASSSTAKVQLTWDETDHERVTALSRKLGKDELMEMDFRAYLASSSSEEEEAEPEPEGAEPEEEEGGASKYRKLLRSIKEKEEKQAEEKNMEMEITWVPGLKERTERLVKKQLEAERTPWEEFLQKKKEKKKTKKKKKQNVAEVSDGDLSPDEDEQQQRRAQMELLMDDDDDGRKHFDFDRIVEQQNLSRKKKKRQKKKNGEETTEDDFQLDVNDPRFQAVFTSHLFNLDPSHPSYRRTSGTASLQAEKRRRRLETPTQAPPTTAAAADPGLSLLVKSIKSKTKQFQARKKQKTSE